MSCQIGPLLLHVLHLKFKSKFKLIYNNLDCYNIDQLEFRFKVLIKHMFNDLRRWEKECLILEHACG